MAYTALNLITDAYYISNIVSRDFESLDGNQADIGLQFLNEVIADKTVEIGMIPYRTNATFTGVVGQEAYPITDLIEIDTLVYFIDDIRYPMRAMDANRYFGRGRADNINSLPYQYHVERNFDGATIYIYFPPVDTYTFEYWGRARLAQIATLTQDLELTLDKFYTSYLKYALVERLCDEYGMQMMPGPAKRYQSYVRYIKKKSATMDTTSTKRSTLQRQTYINYAQVNIGDFWYP